MIVGQAEGAKLAEIEEKGISGVSMKVLIGEREGAPSFVMREFAIEPDGHTAYHTHQWEHEVYVLEGRGAIRQEDREYPVERGSFALVSPHEEHQFINRGPGTFRFICVIPLRKSEA